jgi:hypothetical protein
MPSTICNRDIDYVLAYPTVKMVNIQDARLGLFKIVLLLLIAIYIGVIQLWRDGGYLDTEKVSGVSRFTLQQPTKDSISGSTCDPSADGCKNAFSDPSTLAYCEQSALPYAGQKYPCQFYENVGVQQMFESSLIVDTRITSRKEELVCQASSGTTCPFIYNTSSPEITNYVADIEAFTVLFDTSVACTSLDITGQSSEMEGWLFVKSNDAFCKSYEQAKTTWGGDETATSAPCYVQPNRTSANLDFFELETLLQAADTSLDAETSSGSGETFREAGVTLIMQIEYSNTLSWKGLSRDIQYTYTPYLLGSTSYKIYDAVYSGADNYRQNRTLLNKHGVKIDLLQTGELGSFSFSALLLSLTTSLTLLAVATVATDFVALYLLPDKEKYDDAKFEWTEDFSDLRDQEEAAKRAMRRSGRRSGGSIDDKNRRLLNVDDGSYGA